MAGYQGNYSQGQGRSNPNTLQAQAPGLPQLQPLLKNGKLNPENFKEDFLSMTAKAIKFVSKTQMRKIFDEIKRFKFMLEEGASWDDVYPLVLMQKSKISYLCKRSSDTYKSDASYYKNLKELTFSLIDKCDSEKAYEAYVNFMEALYGFYYEIAPKK